MTERRTALARSFDAQPCRGAAIGDLVLDLFAVTYRPSAVAPEVIEENHRPIAEQLASLRFFNRNAQCPTHAGILLFGKDPLQWMSGAYVQFVRYAGPGLEDDVLEEKTFSGDLLTILRELDSFIKIAITRGVEADSPLHERTTMDYPVVAIREFLMNAIMHRLYEATAPVRFYWFSDHIDIHSPGGLYGEATRENFPRQNAYRNPVIAEAMKALGYVNKYGRGVLRAQKALRDNGNPEAAFELASTYVLVTMARRP